MIPYLILIILIIFGLIFIKNKKIKNIYFYIISILLIILSAFRSIDIGNDTVQYVNFFKKISLKNYMQFINNKYFEVGYIYLTFIIKLLFDNYIYFLLITSLIIYYGIIRFIDLNSKNKLLSLLIFILLLYYFESMSAIRQYISISIVLLSFSFIKKRKIIFYFISIFVATLVHKSAFLCILFYFLYKKNISNKFKIIILLICLFLLVFGNSFLTVLLIKLNFYSSYIDRIGLVHFASIIGMFISLVIYLFIYFVSKKSYMNNCNNNDAFFINMSFIAFILSVLGIKFSIIGRMSLYFEIFCLISIPNSIEAIKEFKTKVVVIFYVVLFCFSYMITIMLLRPDWYEVIPYKTSINYLYWS